MHHKAEVDLVAKHIYEDLFPMTWENATLEARREARVDARTIVAARMVGQSEEEAAARLATWLWVDKRMPHVPWAATPSPVKRLMRKKAKAGYSAFTRLVVPE